MGLRELTGNFEDVGDGVGGAVRMRWRMIVAAARPVVTVTANVTVARTVYVYLLLPLMPLLLVTVTVDDGEVMVGKPFGLRLLGYWEGSGMLGGLMGGIWV